MRSPYAEGKHRFDMAYSLKVNCGASASFTKPRLIRIIPLCARVPNNLERDADNQFIHQPGLQQRARQSRSGFNPYAINLLPAHNCIISTTRSNVRYCAST